MKLPSLGTLSLDSLSERDQRMLKIGGVVIVLLIIFGVIVPLDHGVSAAQARLKKKQADLVWMRDVGPELAAAGPARAASDESLLVVVDRSARESGLSSSLAGSEPSGPGGLSVRLQRASFDTLVAWLARLSQQNGIRVETASIENAGAPGLVNAAVVLHTS
jgi:general secretion pathway protein M